MCFSLLCCREQNDWCHHEGIVYYLKCMNVIVKFVAVILCTDKFGGVVLLDSSWISWTEALMHGICC